MFSAPLPVLCFCCDVVLSGAQGFALSASQERKCFPCMLSIPKRLAQGTALHSRVSVSYKTRPCAPTVSEHPGYLYDNICPKTSNIFDRACPDRDRRGQGAVSGSFAGDAFRNDFRAAGQVSPVPLPSGFESDSPPGFSKKEWKGVRSFMVFLAILEKSMPISRYILNCSSMFFL